jgi:hypothetical protein
MTANENVINDNGIFVKKNHPENENLGGVKKK